MSNSVKKGIYKHYKGGLYEALGVAKHSENGEMLVIYRSLSGEGIWARPIEMWDNIIYEDVCRFTFVSESIEECFGVVHTMRLYPAPFEKIKTGVKTIELRLYDDKRHRVKEGDYIKFVSTEDSDKIIVAKVVKMHIFDSFAELYDKLPLLKCGYNEDNVLSASPEDMNEYYSPVEQKIYGVVGIEIEL